MKRLYWLFFISCLFFSAPLFALRCGHTLVEPGDYKDDVYDRCGEPDSVQSHYEIRSVRNRLDFNQNYFNNQRIFPNNSINLGQSYNREVEVLVEEWIYDFGRSRLHQLLRFENGRLIEIQSLGKNGHRR